MMDSLLGNSDPCLLCKAVKPIMVTEYSKADTTVIRKICFDCLKGRQNSFYCCICKETKLSGMFSKTQRKKKEKKCSECVKSLGGKKRKHTDNERSNKKQKVTSNATLSSISSPQLNTNIQEKEKVVLLKNLFPPGF